MPEHLPQETDLDDDPFPENEVTQLVENPGPRPARAPVSTGVVSRSSASAPSNSPQEMTERQRIARALDQCGGNQTRAAKLLGISRRTLINRLDSLGMPRPRKRTGEHM
jgi:DNA-binding NtrC family response regulator